MRADLFTARVRSALGIDEVAKILNVAPSLVYAWEHYEREVPLHFGVKLATAYRVGIDEIEWERPESDIAIASRFLRVSPRTLRQMMRQGLYGIATPGTRSRLIYIVDWNEVEYGLEYKRTKRRNEET